MAAKITVAELLVDVGLDSKAATSSADKFDKRMAATVKTASALTRGVASAAKGIATFAAGATAAATAIFTFAHSVAKSGDEIIKTSKKIGSNVEELQRLRFAADRSGASVEKMDLSIKNISKNMEDAKNGAAIPFRAAISELGLSLNDLSEMSVEEKIGTIGDAMQSVTDVGQRTALAMNLFGSRAGPELIPLLLEGSKGIKALGDEAESLGLIMSEDSARTSEVFIDAWTNVKALITGLKNTIGVELLPQIISVLKRFEDWAKANKDLVKVRVADFLKRVTSALERLLPFFEKLAEVLVLILENFDKLLLLMVGGKLIPAFVAVAGGLRTVGAAAWAAFGPVSLLLGALVAITPAALSAARSMTDSRMKALEDKAGFTPGSADDVAAGKEKSGIRSAKKQIDQDKARILEIQRFSGQTSGGSIEKLQARIGLNQAKIEALKARTAQSNEAEAPDAPSLYPDTQIIPFGEMGPLLPPGGLEKPEKKSGGGAKKKEALSIHTVQDLINAAAGGEIADLAAATPSVREIEPTVAIDITNNTFNFDTKQTINGVSDPVRAGQESAKQFEENFRRKLSTAAQRLKNPVII